MNLNVRDCLVTGYELLIPILELSDPNDRHVLAAAIHCRADFIVTFNLKDFPLSYLSSYSIKAIHPDQFILELIDIDPVAVYQATEKQRNTLKNPPITRDKYMETLSKQGLCQTVSTLKDLFPFN